MRPSLQLKNIAPLFFFQWVALRFREMTYKKKKTLSFLSAIFWRCIVDRGTRRNFTINLLNSKQADFFLIV